MILQHLVVFVVLILGASGLSFAQSAKPAGLESLQGYVGKYPTDVALWEKEPLQSRLKALLGARYSTFVANTKTNSPVARYGDVMWTSGNKPHAGGSDAALFLADIKANVIEVYLLSKGVLSHHAERGAAVPIEGDAKTTLTNMQESVRRK